MLAGVMLGGAVSLVKAGEQKAEKSRIRKVISSKWFKMGVGAVLFACGCELIRRDIGRTMAPVQHYTSDGQPYINNA